MWGLRRGRAWPPAGPREDAHLAAAYSHLREPFPPASPLPPCPARPRPRPREAPPPAAAHSAPCRRGGARPRPASRAVLSFFLLLFLSLSSWVTPLPSLPPSCSLCYCFQSQSFCHSFFHTTNTSVAETGQRMGIRQRRQNLPA